MKNQEINFVWNERIMYYDGLILGMGMTDHHEHVITAWMDESPTHSQYAYIWLAPGDVKDFMDCKKSYHEVIVSSPRILSWKTTAPEVFESLRVSDFLMHYGPEPDLDLEGFMGAVRYRASQEVT